VGQQAAEEDNRRATERTAQVAGGATESEPGPLEFAAYEAHIYSSEGNQTHDDGGPSGRTQEQREDEGAEGLEGEADLLQLLEDRYSRFHHR